MKEPGEVLPPTGVDLALVPLPEDDESEYPGPFTSLGDPLLDLGYGSAIETSMSGSLSARGSPDRLT